MLMLNIFFYLFFLQLCKFKFNSTHLIDTNIIANIKYLPSKGTTNDVGGIISTTNKKNTWRLINIEIDNVTCKRKI